MSGIYEPKGRAREYSPLALNLYHGCDHGCAYCYMRRFRGGPAVSQAMPIKNIHGILPHTCFMHRKTDKQVLLCFSCDPYCSADVEFRVTRSALIEMSDQEIPTAILTKGGMRALRDLDVVETMDRVAVGATLTFLDTDDSLRIEPGAAPSQERLAMLAAFHDTGVRTFVSFEPVIDPDQTLALMELSAPDVDHFKIGKVNGWSDGRRVDWADFLSRAVELSERLGVDYYIKKDLYEQGGRPPFVTPDHLDADRFAV